MANSSENRPELAGTGGGDERAPDHTEHARLWSVDDVARVCGVSERTVRTWIAHRGLPAIRVGRVLRLDPVSVRAWLAARERQDGGAA